MKHFFYSLATVANYFILYFNSIASKTKSFTVAFSDSPNTVARSFSRSLFSFLIFSVGFNLYFTSPGQTYPIYAQQNYQNPREANGRIVCANCHLAQKPVEIEVPQSILPNTVFEAVVKIPYDQQIKQVLGNGKKGPLKDRKSVV